MNILRDFLAGRGNVGGDSAGGPRVWVSHGHRRDATTKRAEDLATAGEILARGAVQAEINKKEPLRIAATDTGHDSRKAPGPFGSPITAESGCWGDFPTDSVPHVHRDASSSAFSVPVVVLRSVAAPCRFAALISPPSMGLLKVRAPRSAGHLQTTCFPLVEIRPRRSFAGVFCFFLRLIGRGNFAVEIRPC